MPMVAKEDSVLVFLAPFGEESMQHSALYRICNSLTLEFPSVSVLEFTSSSSMVQLSSSKSSSLFSDLGPVYMEAGLAR